MADLGSRTRIYFAIIIVFWTIIIIGSSNYINYKTTDIQHTDIPQTQTQNINNLGDKIDINKKCQFVPPKEKTIIFRLDDVQKYAWNYIIINITDDVLKRNFSIVLGVIPRGIENDSIIINYLIGKIKDPRIEIAQHGVNHLDNEFKFLNDTQTYTLARSGLEEIVNSLKIYPITFIPPNNEYNEKTTKSLKRLGFKIISAKEDEFKFDGNMFHIGFTKQTKYLEYKELTPVKDILNSCNLSLEKKNICVVSIHPQDYITDGKLDKNKYKEFTRLLNEFKKLKFKSKTFKDLINC